MINLTGGLFFFPDVDGRPAEGVGVGRRGAGEVGEGLLDAGDVPARQEDDAADLLQPLPLGHRRHAQHGRHVDLGQHAVGRTAVPLAAVVHQAGLHFEPVVERVLRGGLGGRGGRGRQDLFQPRVTLGEEVLVELRRVALQPGADVDEGDGQEVVRGLDGYSVVSRDFMKLK